LIPINTGTKMHPKKVEIGVLKKVILQIRKIESNSPTFAYV